MNIGGNPTLLICAEVLFLWNASDCIYTAHNFLARVITTYTCVHVHVLHVLLLVLQIERLSILKIAQTQATNHIKATCTNIPPQDPTI